MWEQNPAQKKSNEELTFLTLSVQRIKDPSLHPSRLKDHELPNQEHRSLIRVLAATTDVALLTARGRGGGLFVSELSSCRQCTHAVQPTRRHLGVHCRAEALVNLQLMQNSNNDPFILIYVHCTASYICIA